VLGIFILSVALAGCGNLKKKEFDEIFTTYKNEEHPAYHAENHYSKGQVDDKLADKEKALSEKIADAEKAAKEHANAGDEQTAADTTEKIETGDNKVRADAEKFASTAETSAKEYARAQDEQVRRQLRSDISAMRTRADTANNLAQSAVGKIQELDKAQKDLAGSQAKKVATVLFGSNRATLSKEAKAELDKTVETINKYPGAVIVVKGHADGRVVLGGKYRSNWDLSEARAKAVVSYLKSKGITNEMKAEARAHTEPIADPFTRAGQKKNRRAEVIVYPGGSEM
jgi:flagellar motor protein MotB